jgi:hypothetical protein
VSTARLMDARIAALAAQLEAASLPRERERITALLSALQMAFTARHGPTAEDSAHLRAEALACAEQIRLGVRAVNGRAQD